jgi:AcrR family transcriptional regulator
VEDVESSGPAAVDREPARVPEEGSRERLISAAVDLALEHHETGAGLRDVFAHLTPGAVAERAGLSRGLIYHHWGDPDAVGSEAFTRFLSAVSDELWARSAVPDDLATLADLLPDNVSDVLLALTDYEQGRFTGRDRATFRASQALVLHGALPEGEAEVVVLRMAALYEALGAKLGLEPVPPLTFVDVAVALMCTFEGFGLFQSVLYDRTVRRLRWTPHHPASTPEPDWSLLAVTVEGIVRNMTRPVDHGDDASAD